MKKLILLISILILFSSFVTAFEIIYDEDYEIDAGQWVENGSLINVSGDEFRNGSQSLGINITISNVASNSWFLKNISNGTITMDFNFYFDDDFGGAYYILVGDNDTCINGTQVKQMGINFPGGGPDQVQRFGGIQIGVATHGIGDGWRNYILKFYKPGAVWIFNVSQNGNPIGLDLTAPAGQVIDNIGCIALGGGLGSKGFIDDMLIIVEEESTPLTTNITLLTPTDSSNLNQITNNFTYYFAADRVLDNCSLWSNFSGTWEINETDTTPTNDSNNLFANKNLSDGTYIWNVNCHNESFWGATNFTLDIDLSSPVLKSNFINNSYLYPNIIGQFNFSDNNLIHSVNITIPTNNNLIVFNQSNIGSSLFVANISFNITNRVAGSNILQVEFSDGGTVKEIKDNYDFSVGLLKGEIQYDFPEGNYLKTKIEGSSIFDEWTSIKQKDRYIQIYERNRASSSVSFIEESDTPIYIYEKPGHHGGIWIVTGNHWKDYVLKDEPKAKVMITPITRNRVRVDISGIVKNQKRLEFQSIGGLNKVVINYTFFGENVTETFNYEVSNLVFTDLTLDFNGIGHSAPSNVILEFNGTNYSATQTNNDAVLARYFQSVLVNVTVNSTITQLNVSHKWFFNLTNMSSTPYVNQLVSFVSMDNCSTFTTVAANFTTKRDDTDALVFSELNGFFQFELNGTTHYFNISSSSNTSHLLCIFPNSASYVVDAQIEYINNTYNTETYHFINATFTNVTQFIDLLFTPNATLVNFIVKDENDDPVSNVFINVLQYDFGTNTHRITEILKTDTQGEALGSIVLDTQWYKFLLNHNLVTVFESEPVKITTTTRTFRINLLTDFFETFNIFRNMVADVSFTNATRNFAFTFSNPTGNSIEACLDVDQVSAAGVTNFNDSCITASSGTILINLGSPADVVDNHYLGRGFIQTNPSDPTTKLQADEDEANFVVSFKTFGSEGIFISYMARMTVALIGIWSPVAAILGLVAIDIAMVWMGLYHMDLFVMWSYIIMAVIVIVKVSRR